MKPAKAASPAKSPRRLIASDSPKAPRDATPTPIARKDLVTLGVILLVALAARLVFLGSVPPAMNQDEVGRAYDGWCIWETGADQHGVKWPILLRQFGPGDYSGAMDAYLVAPFVGLLGPTPSVARLPLALAGTLGVTLLWWWARRELDPVAAAAAAAILALSPCHVHQSRMCVDVLLVPTLITAGLAALSAAGFRFRGGAAQLRWPLMAVAGVLFAAGLYSYVSARAAVPLTLLALLAAFPGRILQQLKDPRGRIAVAIFVVSLFVALTPFVVTLIRHPEQVFGRAAHVSIMNPEAAGGSRLATFVTNYAAHLDPRFLFLTGDASPLNSISGLGMLPYYALVLTPIGIWAAVRAAHLNGMAKWCLIWLVVAPIPASLAASGAPHAFRSNPALPPLALLAGLGISWIFSQCKGRRRLIRASAALVAALVAMLTTASQAYHYFVRVPRTDDMAYQAELAQGFDYLRKSGKTYDHYIITGYANQPYIYLLFFGQITPQQWRGGHVVREPFDQGMEIVTQFNEYYFISPQNWTGEYLQHLSKGWSAGERVLFVARPGQVRRSASLIRTFYDGGGSPVLELWEVRAEEI